jgi:hypothetical protein
MARYERSIYFDRLLELQRSYGALGAADTTPVMTIFEVAAFAERVFAAAAERRTDSDGTPTPEADAAA